MMRTDDQREAVLLPTVDPTRQEMLKSEFVRNEQGIGVPRWAKNRVKVIDVKELGTRMPKRCETGAIGITLPI